MRWWRHGVETHGHKNPWSQKAHARVRLRTQYGRGKKKSDQECAISRIERSATRRQRCSQGSGKLRCWCYRQNPGQYGGREGQKLILRRSGNRSRRDRLRLRGGRCGATRPAAMTGSVCDAPDAGRRGLSPEDGRPSQQQAANNGQRRSHVLSIIQRTETDSTVFGLCLSIFGLLVGRPDF